MGSDVPDGESKLVLDARGLFCPEPLFRTIDEVRRLDQGEILEVMVTSPAALEDIVSWSEKTCQAILSQACYGREYRIAIRKMQEV